MRAFYPHVSRLLTHTRARPPRYFMPVVQLPSVSSTSRGHAQHARDKRRYGREQTAISRALAKREGEQERGQEGGGTTGQQWSPSHHVGLHQDAQALPRRNTRAMNRSPQMWVPPPLASSLSVRTGDRDRAPDRPIRTPVRAGCSGAGGGDPVASPEPPRRAWCTGDCALSDTAPNFRRRRWTIGERSARGRAPFPLSGVAFCWCPDTARTPAAARAVAKPPVAFGATRFLSRATSLSAVGDGRILFPLRSIVA